MNADQGYQFISDEWMKRLNDAISLSAWMVNEGDWAMSLLNDFGELTTPFPSDRGARDNLIHGIGGQRAAITCESCI